MSLEFLEGAPFKGLDDVGVVGVGENDVAPVLEHLGPFQILDLHLSADVLGALAPFEFDTLHPEFFNRISMDIQTAVFQVGLHDDRAVTVFLIIRIELHPALQIDGIDDRAFFEYGLRIHADNVLTDRQARSRQGGANGEPFPVVLCDIGGPDAGNQPGEAKFDTLIVTDLHFEVDGRKDRLVAVGFDAVCADDRSHDVEMRIIDGIPLLGRRGDHAEGLGIDDLVAAVSGFSDFTHADATVDAGDAHARRRRDGLFRPVLRECRAGGVDS